MVENHAKIYSCGYYPLIHWAICSLESFIYELYSFQADFEKKKKSFPVKLIMNDLSFFQIPLHLRYAFCVCAGDVFSVIQTCLHLLFIISYVSENLGNT